MDNAYDMGRKRGQEESRIEIEQLRKEKEWSVEEINDYDSGILNDYGGGNTDWWMNYIRTEIDRCNEHWREALKEE